MCRTGDIEKKIYVYEVKVKKRKEKIWTNKVGEN